MDITFLIIDDDVNIRKMLSILIRKNGLGSVIAELDSGEHAVEEILFYSPHVVLIDFLLPVKDGVEILSSAKDKGYEGKFIMISQVEDQTMVSRAYERGIVFFINKPVNSIEAVNVIRGVCHNIDLENSLAMIKNAVFNINSERGQVQEKNLDKEINSIFTDIGIVGTMGSSELKKVIYKVNGIKLEDPSATYQLHEIYKEITEVDDNGTELNARTLEQRVRRAIQKALSTIAELGNNDYNNDVFMEYSTMLFDFPQVRKQMKHMEDNREEPGKINVKKFIEGIIAKLNYHHK